MCRKFFLLIVAVIMAVVVSTTATEANSRCLLGEVEIANKVPMALNVQADLWEPGREETKFLMAPMVCLLNNQRQDLSIIDNSANGLFQRTQKEVALLVGPLVVDGIVVNKIDLAALGMSRAHINNTSILVKAAAITAPTTL